MTYYKPDSITVNARTLRVAAASLALTLITGIVTMSLFLGRLDGRLDEITAEVHYLYQHAQPTSPPSVSNFESMNNKKVQP